MLGGAVVLFLVVVVLVAEPREEAVGLGEIGGGESEARACVRLPAAVVVVVVVVWLGWEAL
jgi:hypothetical protein